MKKMFNKKFFLILGSAITLLVVLSVAMIFLTKENTKTFTKEGYIIATGVEGKSDKYYFDKGTTYKQNISSQLVFKDSSGEKVTVAKDNFMHYTDGGLKFLKNGVIMDLDSLDSEAVPYYNVTDKAVLEYSKKSYFIETIDKTLAFNNLAGRISDNKYIFAGVDIKLQLAGNDNIITGDYFEVIYVEDGIIKVENQEVSYQTTAENSYILANEKVKIDLGNKKIYLDDEEKMSLSQMTIDGNENIEIVPEEEEGTGNGSGDGTGNDENPGNNPDQNPNQGNNGGQDGGNQGNDGQNSGEDNPTVPDEPVTPGDGTGNGNDGSGDGTGDGNGDSGNGGGTGNKKSANIELLKASVDSSTIKASFSVSDPDQTIKGDLVVHITNTDTGKRVYSTILDKAQPQEIIVHSLSPDSNYILSINEETDGEYDTQYFQKLFKTDTLGIKLEKKYVAQDSLSYEVVFDEKTKVKSGTITLYNEKYEQIGEPIIVSREDNVASFSGLIANASYNIVLDNIIMENVIYLDTYSITKTVKTLKQTPYLSGLSIKVNNRENEVKSFTLGVNDITDNHKSITALNYYIYEADKLTPDNLNTIQPVVILTKKDKDKIDVPVDGSVIKSKTNYVFKVIADYYDNEKYGEFETSFSEKFLLSGETTITFELDGKNTTFNQIAGTIILNDDTCTVPMSGRNCNPKENNFELKYRKINSGEAWQTLKIENFDPKTLKAKIKVEGLTANTQYEFQLFATVEKFGELPKVDRIGSFDAQTDSLENALVVSNWTQNKSTRENLINVSATITSSSDDQDFSESIKTITFNLYSGNRSDALESGLSITPMKSVTLTEEVAGDFIKYYNKAFVIDTLGTFGIVDEEKITEVYDEETEEYIEVVEIIPAIEVLKKLTNGRKPELKDQYTIEITGISDGVNDIAIVDNYYVFNVPPVFLIEDKIESPKIEVTPILNEQIPNNPEIKELLGRTDKYNRLGDKDIVGFKFNTLVENYSIDVWLKEISDIFGLNRVKELIYYACDAIKNPNCTPEDAVAVKKIDLTATSELVTGANVLRGTTKDDYDDPKDDIQGILKRGKSYIFKLKFNIDTDGVDGADTYYPSTDVKTSKIDVPRTSPIYQMYILNTDKNAVNYQIETYDYDGALDENNIYYSIEIPQQEETPEEDVPEEEIPENEDESEQEDTTPDNPPKPSTTKGELKLTDCKADVTDEDNRPERVCKFSLESLENDSIYNISLKVASIERNFINKKVGTYIYDGEYVYDPNTVRYELITNEFDNKIRIKIIDDKNEKYINRISTYILTLSADGLDNQTIVYTSDKVKECTEGEVSYKCLIVDYADIKQFKAKNITIKLDAYYDSGIINNDFANVDFANPTLGSKVSNIGYILQNNNEYTGTIKYGEYIHFDKQNNITNSSVPIGYYNFVSNSKNNFVLKRETSLTEYAFATKEEQEKTIEKNMIYSLDKISIATKNNELKLNNFSVNNKLLSEVNLNSKNTNSFKFNSIIPRIKIVDITKASKRKIDGATITINTSGFSTDEFEAENGKYYYYVKLYKDVELSEFIQTYPLEINKDTGAAEITLTKYMPGTTYYFQVWAKLKKSNGKFEETMLFDESVTNDYVTKTYSFTTLIGEDEKPENKIFYSDEKPKLTYESIVGEETGNNYLKRELTFLLKARKKIGEYQMKIEIFDINNNKVIEKILSPNTDTKSWDEIKFTLDITPTENEIKNNGAGGYVFGEGYYTFMLTTISTATNLETKEDEVVEYPIYKEPQSITLQQTKNNKIKYLLEKPSFYVERTKYGETELGFKIRVIDDDGTITKNTANKNGEYCVELYDASNTSIKKECGISSKIEKELSYTGLKSGIEYRLKVYANYYVNNINEETKYGEIVTNIYQSTVKYKGTTVGTARPQANLKDNQIEIKYEGAVNITNIKSYSYNLSKMEADGRYGDPIASASNVPAVFSYSSSDQLYELIIKDLKDMSGKEYKLEKNTNYRLTVQYYLDEEGKEALPFDSVSNAYQYNMGSGA